MAARMLAPLWTFGVTTSFTVLAALPSCEKPQNAVAVAATRSATTMPKPAYSLERIERRFNTRMSGDSGGRGGDDSVIGRGVGQLSRSVLGQGELADETAELAGRCVQLLRRRRELLRRGGRLLGRGRDLLGRGGGLLGDGGDLTGGARDGADACGDVDDGLSDRLERDPGLLDRGDAVLGALGALGH